MFPILEANAAQSELSKRVSHLETATKKNHRKDRRRFESQKFAIRHAHKQMDGVWKTVLDLRQVDYQNHCDIKKLEHELKAFRVTVIILFSILFSLFIQKGGLQWLLN